MFYYDGYGWLTEQVIPGRSTDVMPPIETAEMKANFTGTHWVLAEYVKPPAPDTKPAQRAAILAGLAAIDAMTDKARTRRELLLNKVETKTWLRTKDSEAEALRAKLATL